MDGRANWSTESSIGEPGGIENQIRTPFPPLPNTQSLRIRLMVVKDLSGTVTIPSGNRPSEPFLRQAKDVSSIAFGRWGCVINRLAMARLL